MLTGNFTAEYGRATGGIVNVVTKSGTNEFHGNAQYLWNGRAINSNNWFNNATDTPRAFSNANQWAAKPITPDALYTAIEALHTAA